jgi:hypothetical protein
MPMLNLVPARGLGDVRRRTLKKLDCDEIRQCNVRDDKQDDKSSHSFHLGSGHLPRIAHFKSGSLLS